MLVLITRKKNNMLSLCYCESCLLTNYNVDGVDRLCKKGADSTKLKLVNESSMESMGLTSGIRKVTPTEAFIQYEIALNSIKTNM